MGDVIEKDITSINNNHFYNYNTLNPNNKIIVSIGVSYCIMLKQ